MGTWPLNLIISSGLMPHGFCYTWESSLIWVHGLSDFVIFISYLLISCLLVYFVFKRKNLPFSKMFIAFGLFIVACGVTHLMAIVTIWEPVYWISGSIKLFTAIISAFTAIALVWLMPKILTLPTPMELLVVNQNLATVNAELEAFSYSVSHDLRAPLRGMDGFSRALLEDYEDKLDDEGKDHLRMLSSSANHMSELIDALLVLSRITRREIKRERIDLRELALKIVEDLKYTNPKHKVVFNVEDNLYTNGDANLIKALLHNLIENAWKYSENRSPAKIEFGSKQEGGKEVFYIKDNGAGFDMKYSDKLFGAFQRLHGEAEFKGIGIGLATAQRIINRHGGRIWAEGKVDEGATFYFTLGTGELL